MRAVLDGPDQMTREDQAEAKGPDNGQERRGQKGKPRDHHQHINQERAAHDKIAMPEIDNRGRAINHGQGQRDQRVQGALRDAAERKLHEHPVMAGRGSGRAPGGFSKARPSASARWSFHL